MSKNHYYNQAAKLCLKEKYRESIKQFKKALSLEPKNSDIYNDMGNAYFMFGEHGNAIENYNKVIELNLDDAEKRARGYYNRAAAHHALELWNNAIEDYGIAIELQDKKAMAYNNRGLVHEGMGELEKAVEDFTRSIELEPCPRNYHNRGRVNRALGKEDESFNDHWQGTMLSKMSTDDM